MAKGKRKKHRKGRKITFGRTMAAGGEFSSSVGVVISWIIGILITSNAGRECENINGICDDVDPCSSYSKKSCKGAKLGVTCEYKDSGTYSTGVRVMYIIGGLLTILFGVGIIMLSYWFRGAVHRNKNMAAFAGGLFGIETLGAALRN